MSYQIPQGGFAGAVRSSRTLHGTVLAETAYGTGLRVGMHAHDRPIMCLVLDGAFVERRERGTDRCLPGELLYHPGSAVHGHEFVAPCRLFNVQASSTWLASMQLPPLPTQPRVIRHGLMPWYARRLAAETALTDAAAPLATETELLSLMSEIARGREVHERRAPAWLARVLEALDASDVGAPAPTLKQLSGIVDVHPAHMARTVRQFLGCSVGDYLRRRRLVGARVALVRTTRPLSMVAADAGFWDQAHFTRAFRQTFGVTPGVVRKG